MTMFQISSTNNNVINNNDKNESQGYLEEVTDIAAIHGPLQPSEAIMSTAGNSVCIYFCYLGPSSGNW